MSDPDRFLRVAATLASAIYYGRAEVFGLEDCPHWDALNGATKRRYVEQAESILLANRPPSTENTFEGAHAPR